VVHQPEHIQECAELFVRTASLAEINRELVDVQPSGFQIGGEHLPFLPEALELGEPVARGARLGIQPRGNLGRRLQATLDLDQAAFEFGPR
jgi:hypothetical protein